MARQPGEATLDLPQTRAGTTTDPAYDGPWLQLVAALSREWSWYRSETSCGKVVWARQVW
jgi:hypothetical protein